jgi:hypothetical protein
MAAPQLKWTQNDDAIRAIVAAAQHPTLSVGGRFISGATEAEEDEMAAVLLREGLSLSDGGQFEIVAAKEVATSESSIRQTMDELRALAARLNYRLQAIEAGHSEGIVTVLASEVGYLHWRNVR